MKSFRNLLTLFIAVTAMIFMTSCGEDDVVIDPGGDGINVADGLYIAAADADPVATAGLVAESVEDDGFGSQPRTGFVAGYIYLAAGSYNLVEIADKEETGSWGGTASAESDMGSGCDFNDYTLVNLAADGPGFSVANAGLYKVTFDNLTSELILYQIVQAGVIGSATPGGWGSDTEITGTVNAEAGSWTAENVELRAGEIKLRFNCRWNLDRRIDPAAGFEEANGYQLFTNFGGAVDNLETGNDGPNIPWAEADEGLYTIAVTWDPADGIALALTKTGDVAPITFNPDENQWAMTGDATPNGWADDDTTNDPIGVDHDLNYEGVDAGTYTWVMETIDLIPGGLKFRANDMWDKNMGCTTPLTLAGDSGDFTCDGENIKVNNAATYKVVLTTSDDGDSYTATFEIL